ncbi:MAG: sulfatase-like hydrolase/transferase [Gammaproteobacteria bacterium]|nr:sulfatase-like hydrolase/transferase [Gammaproteobacteria bacterium]
MQKTNVNVNKNTLFWPLVRLTSLFIVAQCVILMLNFGSILSATPVNKFIFQQVIHSPMVIFGIVKFVAAQLILQLALILLVMFCCNFIQRLFKLTQSAYISLGLLLWFDTIIAIFLANQIYYTHSVFAFLLNLKKSYPSLINYITPHSLKMTLFVTTSLAALAVLLAVIGLMIWLIKRPKVLLLVALVPAVGTASTVYWHHHTDSELTIAAENHASGSRPNIILVSIDYFRPGDTVYFGNKTELTPNIDAMLQQSTVFKHSLSVIARTYPSLMSVESGSYPIKSGARFNLINPNDVNRQETLAHDLQNQGYYTMLATDGSHFFYMTPDYGYNKIVAPPPGLNEFLLSSINDFPLSNLLMNTFIGKYLFPYNYMNRNASYTYEPKTFNEELQNALSTRPTNKPLYIHIHMTLGAWPYSWKDATPPIPTNLSKVEQVHYRFNLGVMAVDKQFGQVIAMLQAEHLLDNTMLVVFSDHGQGFGEPGDRLTQKPNLVGKATPAQVFQFTELNVAIGHGTDILSMKQYHPLLAFRLYGAAQPNQIGSRPLNVSLIDIAPTALDYLHLSSSQMQGLSLLPEITGNPQTGLGDAPIFMETEFTLPSILTADPSISKVLNEGLSYYDLNLKTGNLQVKPMIGKLIIKGKQRSILQGKWLLAFYPNTTGPGTLVLVNMETKQWTVDMSDAFAQSSPVQQMAKELGDFYGKEIIMPTVPTVSATAESTVQPDIMLQGGKAVPLIAVSSPVPTPTNQ